MRTFGGFGQIPQAKVALQLHRIKVGNRAGHDDSSFTRTGGERGPPGLGSPERSRRLTRRSASRRPTPGREAAKSPCQHVDHKHQASAPGDYTANEITAAGTHSRHPLQPLTFARLPKARRTTRPAR